MTVSNPAEARTLSAPSDWQATLAESVTDPIELCRLLELPESVAEEARRAAGPFGLLVPRPFLARMRPGNLADPLLRQVLPTDAELCHLAGYCEDPLGEATASPAPGLLSKYRGRSLMVTTRQCGVHCRFCFRRHQAGPVGEIGSAGLEAAIAQAAKDPQLTEIILSGGDPLLLEDDRLGALAERLAALPRLRRLRIHTRLPLLVPQRVTPGLLASIRSSRLAVIFVLHVNHTAEIDRSAAAAITRLSDAGVPLLSQSVLLRGVNDDVETLVGLFERLIDLRVMPYYLHQLDRVAGAGHFEVPASVGVRLVGELRSRLPGYAVPRYVRDVPGNPNKQPLA